MIAGPTAQRVVALSIGTLLALVAAACANTPLAAPASSSPQVVELSVAADTTVAQSVTTSTSTAGSPPTSRPRPMFVFPTDLFDGAPSTTTSSIPDEPLDTRAPEPTAPRPPLDPSALYQGFLGTLGLDTPVAAPVAPAPTAAPGTHPLTGIAGTAVDRAALVVKIDNSEAARPHTGLEAADLIIEEEVEGGITRLAAVFHSAGGDVGPVRSGRTTDISYLSGFGRPILAYSGANELTEAMIRRQELVQNLGALRFGAYWRNSSRRSPHNMYTSAPQLWAAAQASIPPAQFTYRSAGTAVRGQGVAGATVSFPAVSIDWSWTGDIWSRSQGGTPHTTVTGETLTAANVVVVEVAEIPTGMKDSSGAVVPEFVFVGTGPATVLSGGKAVSGVWTRPTLRDAATLTRGDGTVIEMTPGVTWIEIVTAGALSLR